MFGNQPPPPQPPGGQGLLPPRLPRPLPRAAPGGQALPPRAHRGPAPAATLGPESRRGPPGPLLPPGQAPRPPNLQVGPQSITLGLQTDQKLVKKIVEVKKPSQNGAFCSPLLLITWPPSPRGPPSGPGSPRAFPPGPRGHLPAPPGPPGGHRPRYHSPRVPRQPRSVSYSRPFAGPHFGR